MTVIRKLDDILQSNDRTIQVKSVPDAIASNNQVKPLIIMDNTALDLTTEYEQK